MGSRWGPRATRRLWQGLQLHLRAGWQGWSLVLGWARRFRHLAAASRLFAKALSPNSASPSPDFTLPLACHPVTQSPSVHLQSHQIVQGLGGIPALLLSDCLLPLLTLTISVPDDRRPIQFGEPTLFVPCDPYIHI